MVNKRILYPVVAALGIAVASLAAWWLQRPGAAVKAADSSTSGLPVPSGASSAGPGAGDPARPVSVEVAQVQTQRVVDDAQSVGSLKSRQSVMLRPEVAGRVQQINFKDGQRVRKGQVLVQLDDQLPQAQLKQSRAELSIAQANHKRNQELLAQNFISQRSVDESAANLEVALAKLALADATVARLKILAPFDGTTGLRAVNVGDYLKDGADIVNVEDIDTILVDYRLPERFQTKLKTGQKVSVILDALPGKKFDAQVIAIDPLIDANGRSIGVRASVSNRQLLLRPGMFARVDTLFGVREKARVIPEEAIVPQGGKLYVIKLVPGADKDALISQRVEVKVGVRRPGQVEVTEGLSPGDTVVTAGHQRLQRDGSPVKVVDLSKRAAAN